MERVHADMSTEYITESNKIHLLQVLLHYVTNYYNLLHVSALSGASSGRKQVQEMFIHQKIRQREYSTFIHRVHTEQL